MEANTVILALSEYNALRDFKTELEKGNTYRTLDYQQIYSGQYLQGVSFVSTDEAVKEITSKNEVLSKQIQDLEVKIQTLNYSAAGSPKIIYKTELTIKDVKKMSIWEFLKWRKT